MLHMTVIHDKLDAKTWINPAAVSMWRAHWTGPDTEDDDTRTDVFFVGEDAAFVVRMPPAKFAAAWRAAMNPV